MVNHARKVATVPGKAQRPSARKEAFYGRNLGKVGGRLVAGAEGFYFGEVCRLGEFIAREYPGAIPTGVAEGKNIVDTAIELLGSDEGMKDDQSRGREPMDVSPGSRPVLCDE